MNKKIALVCPDDLSIVLFCKGIIDTLKHMGSSEVIVLCDIYGNGQDNRYMNVIRSWGGNIVQLKMNRHINVVEDIQYVYRLYRVFKKYNINNVLNISTKPNIYGVFAARLARIDQIFCSVWEEVQHLWKLLHAKLDC